MTDSIRQLQQLAKKFIEERDWQQFHSLKNLSMDISVEAAELMELFMWCEGKDCQEILDSKRKAIEDEVADVFFGLLSFCQQANIDLVSAFQTKLADTALKYPIEKVKGKALKYTEYHH